jgi:hypothetical protein
MKNFPNYRINNFLKNHYKIVFSWVIARSTEKLIKCEIRECDLNIQIFEIHFSLMLIYLRLLYDDLAELVKNFNWELC